MRSKVALFALISVFAALLLWGGYSVWFFMGENYGRALIPMEVPTVKWQIVEGDGHTDRDKIVLARPGTYGQAMASALLDRPVAVDSLERINVEFGQRGDAMELSVGIAASYSFSRLDRAPLRFDDDGSASVEAVNFFPRFEEMRYVVISVRGALRDPVIVTKVEIEFARPGFFEFQTMLGRSLVNTDSWTQRSINDARPDHSPIRVAPVVAVTSWIVLSFALMVAVSIRRRRWRGLMSGAFGLLVAGWLLLDLGWQVMLTGNHVDAVRQYAGKNPAEKRLTEPDGDVFAFIEELKAAIDDPERRVVIFSDFQFTHFRARYFALPQPVVSLKGVSGQWLRRMREGDVLAAVYLTAGLEERGLGELVQMADPVRETRVWPLSEMTGRDAVVDSEGGDERLRLKANERPWLVRSGWFALDPGLWRLDIGIGASERDGWVRLQVFRRSAGDSGQRELLVWRESFVRGSELNDASLSFWVREGEQLLFRVRELDARRTTAGKARLTPIVPAGQVVALSRDGSPPYFLARKLVRTDVGVAYEML